MTPHTPSADKASPVVESKEHAPVENDVKPKKTEHKQGPHSSTKEARRIRKAKKRAAKKAKIAALLSDPDSEDFKKAYKNPFNKYHKLVVKKAKALKKQRRHRERLAKSDTTSSGSATSTDTKET